MIATYMMVNPVINRYFLNCQDKKIQGPINSEAKLYQDLFFLALNSLKINSMARLW